jgi:hypothetical protein
MPKKRGPGRPPLPPGEARSEYVKVRVTKAERAALDRASREAGKDLGGWAREVLLASARPGPRMGEP